MSRWLKSTTQKAYTVQGKVIPSCVTSDNKWLKMTESEYSEIKRMPVISSLIKAGGILVTVKEPEELKNSVEGLKGSNAELIAINTQLQEELKALKAGAGDDKATKKELEAFQKEAKKELEAFQKEAKEELQAKQKALDEALAKLAEYQAKYEG